MNPISDHHTDFSQKAQTASSAGTSPGRDGRSRAFPLSYAQQRLWFLHQFESGSPLYNVYSAYRLSGSLAIGALEQALNEIIRRHAILRTAFQIVDGRPAQVVAPTLTLSLALADLQSLPPHSKEKEVARLAAESSQFPFDLAHPPLFRMTLLQIEEETYVIFLVMHHIIFDGWSVGVFMRELLALYRAFSSGAPSPLSTLPMQYATFAQWQRRWLRGEKLESQLAYWQQQLAAAPGLLSLPTDHPRPPVRPAEGAKKAVQLSQSLTGALQDVSRRENVTLFMTLLAAFKVLLYRYCGQKDVLVGVPTTNRSRAELEELIGLFVNTVVIRTNLSGDPDFQEFLAQVSRVAMEAYAHQELPFGLLVEKLQPERNLSYTPLFQVMFNLQHAPFPEAHLPDLKVAPLKIDNDTAKFDLTLELYETQDNRVTGWFEYSTALFKPQTIERMAAHFQVLLRAIVADPGRRISALPLLEEAEKQQLLVAWNETRRDYPQDKLLHEIFEAQVRQTPDAVAVCFGESRITYAVLNRRANRLARYLHAQGVGSEGLVGICMERGLEMTVALLAVLKAGGAYVPLDPAFPAQRLAYMAADSGMKMVLAQQSLLEILPQLPEIEMICLDRDWPSIAQQPHENLNGRPSPDNLAYVIYTSGSTGRPKGVQIPHRAVVNFLATMRRTPGLTAADILFSVTTLSFDIAVLELFLPLTTGAQVVVADRETAVNGQQIMQTLTDVAATVMQATPTTWRMLVEAGWQGDGQLKMLCGGEALPRDLAERLLQRGGGLWNMYGPTETTVWSAVCRLQPGETKVPIGRPVANTQLYVLDAHMGPVPVGVAGELYIGGEGLARGYWQRPRLTAVQFVPHPFSQQPGARLYRTGDLVRYLPDGSLTFIGRIDHQVKMRGFRIELGEIETTLRQHPHVAEAVLLVREDKAHDKRLVAYLVPDAHTLETSKLQSYLRAKLPGYMVPPAFVVLDALPLTPNGKIDRQALPVPGPARPALQNTYVPPQTSVEREIAAVWQSVLRLDKIGVDDNFFDLGGHSLLAVEVWRALNETHGKKVTLVDLFRYPTVRMLANYMGQEPAAQPSFRKMQDRARKQITAANRRKKQMRKWRKMHE